VQSLEGEPHTLSCIGSCAPPDPCKRQVLLLDDAGINPEAHTQRQVGCPTSQLTCLPRPCSLIDKPYSSTLRPFTTYNLSEAVASSCWRSDTTHQPFATKTEGSAMVRRENQVSDRGWPTQVLNFNRHIRTPRNLSYQLIRNYFV
jgi:hypothetical protein